MNMQKRSDERSKALHRAIAKKLKMNPSLWSIPKNNIQRWKKERKGIMASVVEWERILSSHNRDQVLALIESDCEESVRLRSSSPFTGILSDSERKAIFELYNSKSDPILNGDRKKEK